MANTHKPAVQHQYNRIAKRSASYRNAGCTSLSSQTITIQPHQAAGGKGCTLAATAERSWNDSNGCGKRIIGSSLCLHFSSLNFRAASQSPHYGDGRLCLKRFQNSITNTTPCRTYHWKGTPRCAPTQAKQHLAAAATSRHTRHFLTEILVMSCQCCLRLLPGAAAHPKRTGHYQNNFVSNAMATFCVPSAAFLQFILPATPPKHTRQTVVVCQALVAEGAGNIPHAFHRLPPLGTIQQPCRAAAQPQHTCRFNTIFLSSVPMTYP